MHGQRLGDGKTSPFGNGQGAVTTASSGKGGNTAENRPQKMAGDNKGGGCMNPQSVPPGGPVPNPKPSQGAASEKKPFKLNGG